MAKKKSEKKEASHGIPMMYQTEECGYFPEQKAITVITVAKLFVFNLRIFGNREGINFNLRKVFIVARNCHTVMERSYLVARLKLNKFAVTHAVTVKSLACAENIIFFFGIDISDLQVAFDAVQFNRN